MKLLHITPAFYPATYWGGPIYSLYGLCNALAKTPGVTLRVLTTDTASPSLSDSVEVASFPMHYPGGYEVFVCRRRWATSISPGMLLRLWPMIRWADVVHLTAVYSPPTIPTLLISRLLGKPLVWSPRGALQRWEGSTRTISKAIWERICRALATNRIILHVTSQEEAKESLRRCPGVETTIIPNGVEIPDSLSPTNSNGILRLLYLGRLHPIKGIENLLTACKLLNEESVLSWSLTLAGPGDHAYGQTLRRIIQEYKLSDRVKMVGEVREEKKQQIFENSNLTVVPSYTENFGMVVAESLAHGVPVIASKGTPWRLVEEIGCGLWIENDVESLAKAIEQISRMPLQEMGRRGREWMTKDFSWDERCKEMVEVYFKLLKHPS